MLRPLYERAVDGLPLLGTPIQVAHRYQGSGLSVHAQARKMEKLYADICGATGFVTGLPGFLGSLVTLPLDLAGTAVVQLHFCATVAHLGGHDIRDRAVRERAIDCLTSGTTEQHQQPAEQEARRRLLTKVGERVLRFGIDRMLKKSSQQVFRRFPLVGGILGASSNIYTTKQVAAAARREFLRPTPVLPKSVAARTPAEQEIPVPTA